MRAMSRDQIEQLLAALRAWSERAKDVQGMALVGSWAAGREHAEADLDVVCVVSDPERFRADAGWMAEVDWPSAGLAVGHWTDVDYGAARSRHLKFGGGEEVEMSFVSPAWAGTSPVDPGTRRVASDGMRVLHDPQGLLGRLLTAL
jgi:hypothetical protein